MIRNAKKMKQVIVLCCWLFVGAALADDRKTASDMIKARGFNVEEFDVIGQGKYNLKVYHVINPLANPRTLHKVPVVAAHGIGFDMANMMVAAQNSRPRVPKIDQEVTLYAMENGTDDKGLYFYLSNNNYDVWLIEARAVTDRVMTSLKSDKDKKAFWDFSLDEQALIDLPTQIDFVRLKTGAPKVAYVSYSQSTVFMFCLLSMKPEFSEKLAAFVAVAPVFYANYMRGIVWPSATARLYFGSLSSANPSIPRWALKAYNFYSTYLCSISIFRQTLCRSIWGFIGGPNSRVEMKGGLTDNMFKSTSLKSYEQFYRNAFLKDFRMFDYKDESRNMEEYGQPVPPRYNLSNINLRSIVLFRGVDDYLSDAQDQMLLINRLKVPLFEDHILEGYSHVDFVASPTIVRDLNEPILKVLDKLTDRKVNWIVHTLGEPNPQVLGTKLVTDLRPAQQEAHQEPQQHQTNQDPQQLEQLKLQRQELERQQLERRPSEQQQEQQQRLQQHQQQPQQQHQPNQTQQQQQQLQQQHNQQ